MSFVKEWREPATRAQTRERATEIRLTHRTQYGSRKEKDPLGIHTKEDPKNQKDQSTSESSGNFGNTSVSLSDLCCATATYRVASATSNMLCRSDSRPRASF